MLSTVLKVFLGDPEKATILFKEDKAVVNIPSELAYHTTYRIFSDKVITANEKVLTDADIDLVTIETLGLSEEEDIILMEGLAKYQGIIGASARKFLKQVADQNKPDFTCGAWN